MSKLTDIKYKIEQLDGGAFQNLCDAYLSCLGYKSIYSLGMKSGTDKTAKGNPDTYFLNADKKYIFVMYTTQKTDFCNKTMEDIKKCFNPSLTGVQASEVVEIIYCHTYDRLSPGDDKVLRDYCNDHNASLILKGLDEISTDLYLRYHPIARDFLGISVDTGQITDVQTFIESHDANPISAPLNKEFMFRNNEKDKAISQLSLCNVLVISGPAGIGKTRFALEVCNIFARQNGYKVLCIKSNHLEIYEDLKSTLESNGNYLLLIDDANELSGLHHALDYLVKNGELFSIKIVITVRDYAKNEVLRGILESDKPTTIKLTSLSDDEIRQLMEKLYGITNHLYTDIIIAIAEGNARLAMLAGKIASETQNLNTIRDASELYDHYYSKQIESILAGNTTSIISAGIVAFLQSIHLGNLDNMMGIFKATGITEEQFIVDIKQLHDFELVDICNDKAAKISDQSFGNFMIKYVFIDKKLVSLHQMIEICFEFNKHRTIAACNILLNVFSDVTVQKHIEQEINIIWDNLKSEQNQFLPFLKAFHMVRPTETLLIMQKWIDAEVPLAFNVQSIDFKKADNGRQIKNDIIDILGSFSIHEQLPEAINLLLIYYKKRPDLFMEFYWIFTGKYGINKDSDRFQYYTQNNVVEQFLFNIETDPSDENVLLFIRVAEYYLKLFYTPAEGGRHNTVIFYRIPLKCTDIVISYRKKLWGLLLKIYESGRFTTIIENLLKDYGNEYGETIDYQIVQKDYDSILCFLNKMLNTECLNHCIIAENIKKVVTRAGIINLNQFDTFLNSPKYCIYRTLTNKFIEDDFDLNEAKNRRKNLISQMVRNYSFKEIEYMFRICKEIVENAENNTWALIEGLNYFFNELSKDATTYITAVELYLQYDTPCDINPSCIVKTLFTILPNIEVKDLILKCNYNQQNAWLWAFYTEIPQEQITNEIVVELLAYLASPSLQLRSSGYRPITLLDKYFSVSPGISIAASQIINEHYEESPFVFHLYFSLMLNLHHVNADEVIRRYKGNLSLLEDIYLKLIAYDEHDDYDGTFLIHLLEEDDEFIYKYLERMLMKYEPGYSQNYESYIKRLYKIWRSSDYLERVSHVVTHIFAMVKDNRWKLRYILKHFFTHESNDSKAINNQDEYIKHTINLNNTDVNLMYSIFEAISELSSDRRKKAITQLVTLNPDPELFQNLPIEASHWGGWGSLIPEMEKRITFLSSLLPDLSGLKYLQHKQRIENDIRMWRARIEAEEIDELLRS